MRILSTEPLRRLRGARLALAAVLLASACRSAPQPPNIVLIVVDTLRADRLGWYGGERGVTPSLDRFAAQGAAVFWSAYAQSSSTSPSVASLLTSRYVSQHGVTGNAGPILDDAETTVAEVLKERGYRTGAFFANYLLTRERGFAQGFDVAQVLLQRPRPDAPKPRAAAVNEAALAWVDAAKGTANPLFLYVHYLEPHLPYTVPGDVADRLLERRQRSSEYRGRTRDMLADTTGQLSLPRLLSRLLRDATAAERDESMRPIEDLYDAEVTDVDGHIGELLDALARRGVLEHSVVLFVADHGEEFLDHGRIGHGAALYEETVRVPLAVLVSGSRQRTDVRDVVSLVDVAPTLLDLAAVSVPSSFVGRSFLDLLTVPNGWPRRASSSGAPPRSAFVEQDKKTVRGAANHRRALVVAKRKVVVQRDGATEFFDLESDPTEKQGNSLDAVERRHLLDLLETARRAAEEHAAERRVEEPSDAAKERLRALGYAE